MLFAYIVLIMKVTLLYCRLSKQPRKSKERDPIYSNLTVKR